MPLAPYAAIDEQSRGRRYPEPQPLALREGLAARFYGQVGVRDKLPAVRQAVAEGQLTPWAAAEELLGR